MIRTRVKICGLTRAEDIDAAVSAGTDALGFVFYEPSPRSVSVVQAQALVKSVPAFVCKTGLFVNADVTLVNDAIAHVGLDLLQFHGDESPEYCRQFNRAYMKAIRMRPDIGLVAEMEKYSDAAAILLDAYHPSKPGGTGETFDWDRIPAKRPVPLVLAGGLTPHNIKTAVNTVLPYAVDVSGGVESAKGIKDASLIQQFISEVQSANQG